MSIYTLPSGNASIRKDNGLLSETGFSYRVTGKNQIIEEALMECWKLNAQVQELTSLVAELDDLVTELDAHEGAEGWSDYLEARLKVWRKQRDA